MIMIMKYGSYFGQALIIYFSACASIWPEKQEKILVKEITRRVIANRSPKRL